MPVVILRPAGYESSGRRYPVLYLLHGFNSDEESWLAWTDLLAFTERLMDERSAIVVMPYVPGVGTMIDWREGRYAPERFTVETLIPYIDARYRTIPDGSHRAFAGLSGGGQGSLYLAARHPELVAAVGGFSATSDIEIGETVFVNALQIAAVSAWEVACKQHDPVVFPVCEPLDRLCWARHNPAKLARNLGGLSIYTSVGNGLPCDKADLADPGYYAGAVAEAIVRPMNDTFDAELTAVGIPHRYEPGCGSHSWRYWERGLHRFWDQMIGAFGRPAPTAFDFRSADETFGAWGWTFEVDPARAPEFLDVEDATCGRVALTGSGMTSVRTSSCFEAGQSVGLEGAVESAATSDDTGRISFRVDLGPAHEFQQYMAPARAVEALGGYWVSRTVTFTPET